MKIELKRLVSLMLVLVMLVGMLPTVYAEEISEPTPQDVSADWCRPFESRHRSK